MGKKSKVELFTPTIIELDLEDKAPVAHDGTVVKEYDLGDELAIDPTNLDEELINQPTKYAWAATLAEHAKDFAAQKKMELEELKAELDIEVRTQAAKGETKVTEATVKHMVLQMDSFKEAQQELLAAQKTAQLLTVARDSFSQRANMLISLSANRRVELDGEISALVKKYKGKVSKGDDDDDE